MSTIAVPRPTPRTTTIRSRLTAWIARHLIADDPSPEYSALDRQCGLSHQSTKA